MNKKSSSKSKVNPKAKPKQKPKAAKSELLSLMNVGPAMLRDLHLLNIEHIAQLSKKDPEALYKKLEKVTGHPQDPCVLDVFSAIVHEAKTGEKTPWWHWSEKRKKLRPKGNN